jgi:poly-beta-1,6-N-acetyl-D-glucosamine synthase
MRGSRRHPLRQREFIDTLIRLSEPADTSFFSRIRRLRSRTPRQRISTGRLAVVIPAHNEAGSIAATITSLRLQSKPPDEILVVCDNCTDNTAGIAARLGVRVIATAGNQDKKAGALNQALSWVLPTLSPDDFVLTMDADSALSPDWLATAVDLLSRDKRVGAVCGSFYGEPGCGIIGQIQRNEYVRYARTVQRRGQALVLSGTGSLFRVRLLRDIARERGNRLPGTRGQIYSQQSITEDDEITLAAKTLGWRCMSPAGCGTTTEVMPDARALYRQRLRWQKGTIADLRVYGITKVTAFYWLRQLGIYASLMTSMACVAIIGAGLVEHVGISIPWTIGITGIAFVERTWTVRRAGWRGLVLAMLVLPELVYDLFRAWVFFNALRADLLRRDIAWGHLAEAKETV